MKLLDRMKDEELGQAILHNFTKEYGHVPMDLYDVVLPLIYMDEIRENLSSYHSLKDCITSLIKEDASLVMKFNQYLERYDSITSKALAMAMLSQYLSFQSIDNVMCGVALEAQFLDINEAILLAQMMKGLTKDDILSYFHVDLVKIVVLQSESLGKDVDLSEFNKLGNVITYPIVNQEDVVKYSQGAQIVITNKNIFNKDVIDQLPDLKMIAITATGYNNVDIEYAKEKGIKVCNVKGYSTDTVAQHTLSLALHLLEKNHLYDQYVKSKEYSYSNKFSFFDYSFHDISSLTWGIVGLGNIGRKVADIVMAMGGHVQYYSTSGKNKTTDYKEVDFDTLLATSDIISIHAPLNEKTNHLFNKETMKKMKYHSYLINVGRGPIINEKDLVELLNEGWFDGVGLDVFESEPLDENSPLFDIKNMDKVILTPHIAWASIESRERLVHEVYLNIKAYLNHEDRNVVNN